jgi:hypothetical protein
MAGCSKKTRTTYADIWHMFWMSSQICTIAWHLSTEQDFCQPPWARGPRSQRLDPFRGSSRLLVGYRPVEVRSANTVTDETSLGGQDHSPNTPFRRTCLSVWRAPRGRQTGTSSLRAITRSRSQTTISGVPTAERYSTACLVGPDREVERGWLSWLSPSAFA